MSLQEIMSEIGNLPYLDKQRLLETLNRDVDSKPGLIASSRFAEPISPISEDEIERILFAEGVISLPTLTDYTDEDEDFDPIEVEGEPLSEQIIRERR